MLLLLMMLPPFFLSYVLVRRPKNCIFPKIMRSSRRSIKKWEEDHDDVEVLETGLTQLFPSGYASQAVLNVEDMRQRNLLSL